MMWKSIMSYKLTVESKSNYLHVAVQGDNSPQSVLAYLSEVRNKCVEHGCSNVLIEENLQGPRLNTLQIFEVLREAIASAPPLFLRIAYVDINPEHDRAAMGFAEDVAVNRGINVKIFSSIIEAENWLAR
jgi:hypothetical protein